MSESGPPRFKVVCEGPTDFTVITAILSAVVPGPFRATMIQPEVPRFAGEAFGELGSGWRGIWRWCEQRRAFLGGIAAEVNSALHRPASTLILHVDADIANKQDVNCEKSCPPPAATVDALRKVVLGWAGEESVPNRVVLCIPSKNTEAWVFAALHPGHRLCGPQLECRPEPQALLVGKPGKLVRRKTVRRAGKLVKRAYDKDTKAYEGARPLIAAAWPDVCETCSSEARRFDTDLRAALVPPQ